MHAAIQKQFKSVMLITFLVGIGSALMYRRFNPKTFIPTGLIVNFNQLKTHELIKILPDPERLTSIYKNYILQTSIEKALREVTFVQKIEKAVNCLNIKPAKSRIGKARGFIGISFIKDK